MPSTAPPTISPRTRQAGGCCAPAVRPDLDADAAAALAKIVKALADPVRLRLVSLIASSGSGEACVCDLNTAFDLSQATVSHHLKVLQTAGVLDREKRGVWAYYRVRPEALAAVADVVGSLAPIGATA